MPVASPPPAGEMDTLEDLLNRLGDVPPGRIRLHPPPGTATEQELHKQTATRFGFGSTTYVTVAGPDGAVEYLHAASRSFARVK